MPKRTVTLGKDGDWQTKREQLPAEAEQQTQVVKATDTLAQGEAKDNLAKKTPKPKARKE